MYIGVPKEIKNHEYRVGLTPASVKELVLHGHTVFIENNAGQSIGYNNSDYVAVGAHIKETAQAVFDSAELIVKIKEPQAVERKYLTDKHTLFTYLHLAPDRPQTEDLIQSGAICIAYETVTDNENRLPLLAPMSAVAGRMAIQAGASALEKYRGGRGVLLGGVPGVESAKVVIIGGGVVGENAAEIAVGMGAEVIILDRSLAVLQKLARRFDNRIKTVYATTSTLEQYIKKADLVVGAVLVPGAAAPKLISAEMVSSMQKGAVIVDVAIDQGGCAETSHPTTHADPIYLVDGVVHYCVANMPGAVAHTSTTALNNATLPYILSLADHGVVNALKNDRHLLNGLNVCRGKITCKDVAIALGLPYFSPLEQLNALS